MKKAITLLACLGMILYRIIFPVFAADPSASVTGPSVVRAGDTITVAVNLNGTGLSAVQGEITYDSSQLTYGSNAGILTGWAIDIDGSTAGKVTFLGIDDKLAAPINSNKQLFTLTFTVKSGVATGANIRITAGKLSASDGTSDFEPANAVYSVNVAAPLSSNALLSSLTVSNATITPGFDRNTVNYSATVPFSVSRLEVSAAAQDSKAKVAISGQNLAVGANTVSVVVTAENGSKKTYSISVIREQDPNYQASGNADLKSITPGIGILSPVFDPAKTLYNVYLPFEITSFNATGEAADAKASVAKTEAIELNVGDNDFIITGVAEDGTRKDYKIVVTRMPAQGEEMPDPTPTTAPTQDQGSDVEQGFILSGTISDGNGDPLAGVTVELHSVVQTATTDAEGFYKFTDVALGEHVIVVKSTDGTQIANVPVKIVNGNKAEYKDGVLTVRGDTRFDLTVKNDGFEIAGVLDLEDPGADPAVLPLWGIIAMTAAAAVAGFAASQILNKRKMRADTDRDGDNDIDRANIVF